MDVGKYDIELFVARQICIPLFNNHVFNFIQRSIFIGAFIRPLINVDCGHFFCAFHRGENPQNSGAAAHVENIFIFHFIFQNGFNHQRCGFMVSGSKSHVWFDDYFVFCLLIFGVKRRPYYTFIINYQWFKVIFFPNFIPVLTFNYLFVDGKSKIILKCI